MEKKIIGIIISTLLITTAVLPITTIGNKSDIDNRQLPMIKTNSSDFSKIGVTTDWITFYENDFEDGIWNDTGAFDGPDLWHVTSVDSWSGDSSMACFNENNRHYENNMYYNFVLGPILDMEDVEEMIMNFYCKFITEDSDDHWGIAIFDPGTNSHLSHIWTASTDWGHLPYDTYGYHLNWMGPMQPMGEYKRFDIRSAFENWYDLGYFRDSDGYRSYDLQIGFVFYESDESGYANSEAEAHGDFWSGLFIDDVSIKQLVFNRPPQTPDKPIGPSTGIIESSYEFSTNTIDPDSDTVKYGWDWDGDDIVDEWTSFYSSGTVMSTSHSWTFSGTYNIKVKAEDSNGAKSDFSSGNTIVISNNNPPNKPTITGPASGETNKSYTYSVSTIDLDGDQISYLIDWDDGTDSGWIGPYDSGQMGGASHIWATQGTYSIKVKAKDSNNVESEWSDPLLISMPKTKTISTPLIRFLEKHLHILDLEFIITGTVPCVDIEKKIWDSDEEEWVEEVSVYVCTNVRFTVLVHNCGDNNLAPITVIDTLPSCLEYVQGSAYPIEPMVDENKLIWEFNPPLYPSETLFIEFDVHVKSGGENINTVDVTAESNGLDVTDSDTATVTGIVPPSVKIEKKVSDDGETWNDVVNIEFGEIARFKITVHNDGEKILTNIVVTDKLPNGLEYKNNAEPAEPQISGNELTWTYSSLKPWHILEIEFDTKGVEEGDNINNVTVSAESSQGFIVNDSDTATVYIGEMPVPDLVCEGTLNWTNVKPGSTLTDTIYVKNIGDSGSKLDWKICDFPTWGIWISNQSSGQDLTPAGGSMPITVSVTAPNEKNKQFTGQIKICNEDDSSDYCTIHVSLVTPKNKAITVMPLFLRLLEQHTHMFPILRYLLRL